MDVYLGLGSNLGDRVGHLAGGLAALVAGGFELVKLSPVVESAALLPDDAAPDWNRPYLNMAARCRTALSPERALDVAKDIERRLGRDAGRRWAPRPIDIDILLWGREEICTDRLTVPHPSLTERSFVLAPLVALDARLTIPGRGHKTVLDFSRELRHRIPLWMGIVNATPDSFSDAGELASWDAIERRVDAMLAAGAQILDIGAESTRPGATPLTSAQEWSRLEPVVDGLVQKLTAMPLRPLVSVDTYHPDVARRAIDAGADIVNDVGGLTAPDMIELAASANADWVAMHSLTVPADRGVTLPTDRDPIEQVLAWLDERLEAWSKAGVALEHVIFDPGIGFGKNPLQSLELLRGMKRFHSTGLRCLVGHSRKSFMRGFTDGNAADRDLFTIGASLNLCAQGVDIIRVHDVPAHVTAYRGWAHLLQP
jgi:2-amino-4-hydroxy-6-hydroxymethyldihydropteridine diphosphokinase / dihydropteroate synthase